MFHNVGMYCKQQSNGTYTNEGLKWDLCNLNNQHSKTTEQKKLKIFHKTTIHTHPSSYKLNFSCISFICTRLFSWSSRLYKSKVICGETDLNFLKMEVEVLNGNVETIRLTRKHLRLVKGHFILPNFQVL